MITIEKAVDQTRSQTADYVLKLSPQGQVTLPKALRDRLKVRPGSRIVLKATADGDLTASTKFPIEKYFGSMGTAITGGQDATQFIREMRDEDQQHRDKLNRQ